MGVWDAYAVVGGDADTISYCAAVDADEDCVGGC